MATSTLFNNNRTQAVRLPADVRFPDDVKQVNVRMVGSERIISPLATTWDSFFTSVPVVSSDFMETRASQEQKAREVL